MKVESRQHTITSVVLGTVPAKVEGLVYLLVQGDGWAHLSYADGTFIKSNHPVTFTYHDKAEVSLNVAERPAKVFK